MSISFHLPTLLILSYKYIFKIRHSLDSRQLAGTITATSPSSRQKTSCCISCDSTAASAAWPWACAGNVGSWLWGFFSFLATSLFLIPQYLLPLKIFLHLILGRLHEDSLSSNSKKKCTVCNETNTMEWGRNEQVKSQAPFINRAWNLEPLMLLAPPLLHTGKFFWSWRLTPSWRLHSARSPAPLQITRDGCLAAIALVRLPSAME